MAEQVTFQLRRGESTGLDGWTAVNPTLSAGEPGFELDTDTLKIGNGITRWNNLNILKFGDNVAIGNKAGKTNQGNESVAIGFEAGQNNQGYSSFNDGNPDGLTGYAVAIGYQAGKTKQYERCVAIGNQSGSVNQGFESVAIGDQAGNINQGEASIAIGVGSGENYQGARCVAIGGGAGFTGQAVGSIAIGNQAGDAGQKNYGVAIGYEAGENVQGEYSIAIGYQSGILNQGDNSIAIGRQAATNSSTNNTIILNATGSALNSMPTLGNALYVAPIRNDNSASVGPTYGQLWYNRSSKEIVYETTGLSGTIITGSILPSQDGVFNLGSPTQRFQTVYATTASISTQTLNMTVPGYTGIGYTGDVIIHGQLILGMTGSAGQLVNSSSILSLRKSI